MTGGELAFKPAHQLARLIASRELSPVELMELYLGRIENLNPGLNAFLTISADDGMRSAKAAEKAVLDGEEVGPLHGVPVAVKDLEATAGLRTTYGSLVYRDYVPGHDTGVVARLRRAGAVVIGKTNTPEFGLSGTTDNRLGDDCRNPWDNHRPPAGRARSVLCSGIQRLRAFGRPRGWRPRSRPDAKRRGPRRSQCEPPGVKTDAFFELRGLVMQRIGESRPHHPRFGTDANRHTHTIDGAKSLSNWMRWYTRLAPGTWHPWGIQNTASCGPPLCAHSPQPGP